MTAALRLRVLPRFPARIVGTDGVKVTRDTGSPDLTVSLDFEHLGDIAGVPNPAKNYFAMWNEETGSYVRIPFQSMFDSAGVSAGYPTRAAAELANILPPIHAIELYGDMTVGDGEGGLFIDTDNGSADTFVSGDGRTWYRAEDVNSNRLVDSSVTAPKIADGAVGTDKVADDAVSNAKLADMAEGTFKGRDSTGAGDPENLTAQQVRDRIDPLRGFNANGTVDDTANFTALRVLYPDTDFDLKGKTYRVTAIPSGPFHNGKWRIYGAGEGGSNIDQFAPRTMAADVRKIAWGRDRLSAWAQDKANEFNNTVYSLWMEGDDHVGSDIHIRIDRSLDNGQTWGENPERQFQSATGARGSFSAGICQCRLVVMVREHAGAFSDTTITANRLFSRRCGERREKKVNPYTGIDATTMQIVATNASATFRVANVTRHGCFVGDVINITNVTGTVGGRSVSGNYTVTATGVDWVEFTHPSGAATSSETNTSDFVVNFVEGPFVESLIGGVSFHAAVKAFAGSPYSGTDLWYVHSFVEDPTDASGAFFVGVTGGATGPNIAKVTGMITGTRTLSKLTQINSNAARGEPSIKRLSNGTLVGFLRANSAALAGGVFASTDGGDTWTNYINVPGNNFRSSPIPLAVVNDRIYAIATGNRIRGEVGTGQPGDVPFYLIEGDGAAVAAGGWSALTITKLDNLYFANESHGDLGNGVGVGSVVYNNGVLHVFLSTEKAENVSGIIGAPDMLHLRLLIGSAANDAKALQSFYSHRSQNLMHSGEPSIQHAGRFFGDGAWHILGRITGAAVGWGHGFTVNRPSTGIYDITFTKPLVSANYHVSVISAGNGNVYGAISATPTVNGFQVAMRNGASAGALTNADFTFVVFVEYQPYRTDWSGDPAG